MPWTTIKINYPITVNIPYGYTEEQVWEALDEEAFKSEFMRAVKEAVHGCYSDGRVYS